MENKAKSVRIGTMLKTKKGGTTIRLGQTNPKTPDFNYTVQIRVLNAKGEVVLKATNPWVNLGNPHENAPESILKDLSIWPQTEEA